MARHRRPLIGVTGPDRGGMAAWLATSLAVWRAGGRTRRLTPRRMAATSDLDGLIVGGGADVSPLLYGERLTADDMDSHSGMASATGLLTPLLHGVRRLLSTLAPPGIDHARDQLELTLLRDAEAHDRPVLGICRGMQLLNVHRGGDLHRSLGQFYVEAPELRTLRPGKSVRIEADSHLAAVMGCREARVNALHSQAIRRLGRALGVVARETSGVIQAVEDRGHRFCIGVQWHPEYLPRRPEQQRLFRGLVRAAGQPPSPRSGRAAGAGATTADASRSAAPSAMNASSPTALMSRPT